MAEGKGSKAGDIHFDIHGNTKPLEEDLKNAKTKVSSTAGTESPVASAGGEATRQLKEATKETKNLADAEKEVEAAGASAQGEGGLLGFMRKLRKEQTSQITLFSRMIGQITAIGAVAGIFYSLGKTISETVVEALKTGIDKANEFKESLDLSDVSGSLKKYDENLAELDAKMAERQAGTIRGWASSMLQSDASLQEQINQQRADRQKLAQAAEARRQSDIRNKAAKEAKDKANEEAKHYADTKSDVIEFIAKEQHSADLAMMDERSRAEAESNDKIKELRNKFQKLSFVDQYRESLHFQDAKAAIEQEYQQKIRKINEEEAKKQAEAAKKVSDAWVSSFRSIREASNSVFSTDQAASMVQFSQQMMVSATVAHANMNRIIVEGVG